MHRTGEQAALCQRGFRTLYILCGLAQCQPGVLFRQQRKQLLGTLVHRKAIGILVHHTTSQCDQLIDQVKLLRQFLMGILHPLQRTANHLRHIRRQHGRSLCLINSGSGFTRFGDGIQLVSQVAGDGQFVYTGTEHGVTSFMR